VSIRYEDLLDAENLDVVSLQAETGISRKEMFEMFACLFNLEKSTVTKVDIISTFLRHHFELSKNHARSVVNFWLNNYKAIKVEHDWRTKNWGMF
jgi:hypothetical protein